MPCAWTTKLLCVALLWGCGPDEPPLKRAPSAVLTGRVLLADGAALPAYAAYDVIRNPLHAPTPDSVPAECARSNEEARHAVALGPGRTLGGVVVAAADFTHVTERKPVTHTVSIDGCRLRPATVAAMGGDTLRVENRERFSFAPMFGPAFKSAPLTRGHPVDVTLAAGSVESILCAPSAPCGRTDVVAFHHPAFAVSDAHGAFRIDHFPAGEMVRVSAWHPLFELEETFVWIDAGKTSSVDLVLRPKARFVAP